MKYYTVKKGDTLSKIEKKLGVSGLRKWMLKINLQIKDPNKIQTGWKLRFPTSVKEAFAIQMLDWKEPKLKTNKVFKVLPSSLAKPFPKELPTPRSYEIERSRVLKLPKKLLPQIKFLAKDFLTGEKKYIAKIRKETLKDYPSLAYAARKKLEKIRIDVDFPVRAALSALVKGTNLNTFEGLHKADDWVIPQFKVFGMPIPLSFIKEEEILLNFRNPSVLVHELAHSEFDTWAWTGDKYREFRKTWNEIKYKYSKLRKADSLILQSPKAYSYGPKGLPTAERFAYLAGQVGVKSLNDIPKELQKYYKDFFSPTSLKLPAMGTVV